MVCRIFPFLVFSFLLLGSIAGKAETFAAFQAKADALTSYKQAHGLMKELRSDAKSLGEHEALARIKYLKARTLKAPFGKASAAHRRAVFTHARIVGLFGDWNKARSERQIAILKAIETVEPDENTPAALQYLYLQSTAMQYYNIELLAEAEIWWRKVAEHSFKNFGPDSARGWKAQRYYALSLYEQRKMSFYRAELARILSEPVKAPPKGQRHLSRIYNWHAIGLEKQGDNRQAMIHYEQAFELANADEETSPDYLQDVRGNLGKAYRREGFPLKAEPLLGKAYDYVKNKHGPNHPDTLHMGNGYAIALADAGKHVQSIDLLETLIPLARKSKARKDHDLLPFLLNNLAYTLRLMNLPEKAIPFDQEALDIRIRKLGKDAPLTLASLNNLTVNYSNSFQYEKAMAGIRRAEEFSGIKCNASNLHVRHCELAVLLRKKHHRQTKGDQQAMVNQLERLEAQYGRDDPKLVEALAALSLFHFDKGEFDKARNFNQRTMAVLQAHRGPRNPRTIRTMNALARNAAAAERPLPDLLASLEKFDEALFHWFGRELLQTSSLEQQKGLGHDRLDLIGIATTMAAQHDDPALTRFIARLALKWKGFAQQESVILDQLSKTSHDSEVVAQVKQVNRLRGELANAFENNDADHLEILQQLETAENALSAKVSSFKTTRSRQNVSLEQLQAALGEDEAVIEFIAFRWQKFRTRKYSAGSHYYGLLITRDTITGFMLDLNGKKWKKANLVLQRYQLADFVIDRIGADKTLFISPDGDLNYEPFETYRLSDGRYWIEAQDIRFVHSARVLTDQRHQKLSAKRFVGFGNPDFAAGLGVAPLPHSEAEVKEISQFLEKEAGFSTRIYLKDQSLESLVGEGLDQPSILHLATHGLFDEQATGVHPLLSSSIALTGNDTHDGQLHALEVLGLDLSKVEMVVLSACATVAGASAYGEALYNLPYSLRLAGVKTIIMTLVPVQDDEAKQFMVRFYRKLQQNGFEIATALRQTKLEIIAGQRKNGAIKPSAWAPYIAIR